MWALFVKAFPSQNLYTTATVCSYYFQELLNHFDNNVNLEENNLHGKLQDILNTKELLKPYYS